MQGSGSTQAIFLSSNMPSLDHKIPPPVIGAVVALSMWGVSTIGPQFSLTPALAYGVMAMLVAAGVAFDVLGLVAFRKSRTTVNPLRPERSSTLVTEGVYRVTRNPMYVGMGLLLLAWGVYLSALLPFAGLVIYVWYLTQFQIRPEERALQAIFGDAYLAYSSRVRRWL